MPGKQALEEIFGERIELPDGSHVDCALPKPVPDPDSEPAPTSTGVALAMDDYVQMPTGPRGGHRWRNVHTGHIVYSQQNPGGATAHAMTRQEYMEKIGVNHADPEHAAAAGEAHKQQVYSHLAAGGEKYHGSFQRHPLAGGKEAHSVYIQKGRADGKVAHRMVVRHGDTLDLKNAGEWKSAKEAKEDAKDYIERMHQENGPTEKRRGMEKYLVGTGFEAADLDEMDDKEVYQNWIARGGSLVPPTPEDNKPGVLAPLTDGETRTIDRDAAKAAWREGVETVKQLKPEEHDALVSYAGTGYMKLNKDLRSGTLSGRYEEMAGHLDSAMGKAEPFKTPVRVWRGVNLQLLDAHQFAQNLDRALADGGMYVPPDYQSTSMNPHIAHTFSSKDAPLLEIVARHGIPMTAVMDPSEAQYDSLQHEGGNEHELLLPRQSKFKVVGKKRLDIDLRGTKQKKLVYQLEQVI